MPATLHDHSGVETFTAPTGGVTVGVILDIQDCIIYPLETAAAAASFQGLILNNCGKRVNSVTKKGATASRAWTKGQVVYYDISTDEFTNVVTGNNACGWAADAATSAATTGDVIFGNAVELV